MLARRCSIYYTQIGYLRCITLFVSNELRLVGEELEDEILLL